MALWDPSMKGRGALDERSSNDHRMLDDLSLDGSTATICRGETR